MLLSVEKVLRDSDGIDIWDHGRGRFRVSTGCTLLDGLIAPHLIGGDCIIEWVAHPDVAVHRSVIFDNLLASARDFSSQVVLFTCDQDSITRRSLPGLGIVRPRSAIAARDAIVKLNAVAMSFLMVVCDWDVNGWNELDPSKMDYSFFSLMFASSTMTGASQIMGERAFATTRVLLLPGDPEPQTWDSSTNIRASILETRHDGIQVGREVSFWVNPALGVNDDRSMWEYLSSIPDSPCTLSGSWRAIDLVIDGKPEVVRFNGQGLSRALIGREKARTAMRVACAEAMKKGY